jgi:Lysozyme like domain/Type IV secretion system pilin
MKPLIILFFLLTLISPNPAAAIGGGSASPATPTTGDTFVAPTITDGAIAPGQGFVPCSGEGCSACHFVVLANTIIKWLIGMSFLLFAVLAVKAGFGLVTSGGSTTALSAAKNNFTSAFIGLIIILAAWLMVDTLLRGLLGKDGVLSDGTVEGYGPWSQVQCAAQNAVTTTAFGEFGTDITYVPGGPMQNSSAPPYTGGPLAQCPTSNPACSPAALTSRGFTSAQANVMSCIAMTESSGNPATPPYNIAHPSVNSTACGLFQITRSTWTATATGACSDFATQCRNAACNTQTAQRLVARSGYTPWTCPGCNNKAQHCISQYGG